MDKQEFNLSKIISPLKVEDFFTQYWEKAPLVLQRDKSNYYDGLLALPDVDHIISSMGSRYPTIRLVKDGIPIPLKEYAYDLPWGNDTFTGIINPDAVISEYQRGSTIVLQALQRNWPPLATFCRDLETYFTHPIQTNIYLTPKSSQGLAPHYDTHDVFVLQLYGSKHWKIYESAITLPDRSQPFKTSETVTGSVLYDFELKAGDLIYLPRGYVHEALTSQEESLHITVGIITYTWSDLFNEILSICKKDERFRNSLPLGFANSPQEITNAKEYYRNLLKVLYEEEIFNEAFENVAERFVTTRTPILPGHLLELSELEEITTSSTLQHRKSLIYKIHFNETDTEIFFARKKLKFPKHAEEAIRFIVENKEFGVALIPGRLDEAGKMVLVKRLIKEGFLTIVRK